MPPLREHFALASPDIVAAWSFGSHARGDATPCSDVDVAVLVTEAAAQPDRALATKLEVERALDRLLHREPDVTIVNGAPVDLIHRILRDGILLLDRDPSARVRFEVHARADYFDLVPVLQRYRRYDGVEP